MSFKMDSRMHRYGLRNDQWKRIENILPGREESVGVTAKDNRLFVEAVFYRYRAGIAPLSVSIKMVIFIYGLFRHFII